MRLIVIVWLEKINIKIYRKGNDNHPNFLHQFQLTILSFITIVPPCMHEKILKQHHNVQMGRKCA